MPRKWSNWIITCCKRRHFSIKNTTATGPRHMHSTGGTVLPLGLAQPKEQPRLLQQLSHFYLLPFPEKNLGDLRTWTHHVERVEFCQWLLLWCASNPFFLCPLCFWQIRQDLLLIASWNPTIIRCVQMSLYRESFIHEPAAVVSNVY